MPIMKPLQVLEWIAPRRCVGCGIPMSLGGKNEYPLCAACESGLIRISRPRCERCGKELISERGICWECRQAAHACARVLPLFRYRGFEAELIRIYKMGRRHSLAPLFARLLAFEIRESLAGWTIVPVPPRREKIVSGEMDQVECLARALEREGFTVRRLLVRNSKVQQKRLSRKARMENASAAYAIDPHSAGSCPERAILIDDVYTTGATLDACASALLSAGTTEVAAVVLAAD